MLLDALGCSGVLWGLWDAPDPSSYHHRNDDTEFVQDVTERWNLDDRRWKQGSDQNVGHGQDWNRNSDGGLTRCSAGLFGIFRILHNTCRISFHIAQTNILTDIYVTIAMFAGAFKLPVG